MRGKINKIKQVTAVKTKSVKFVPLYDGYTVQADGELYEGVPLEINVAEGRLKFHTPV